jgi:hypothetical protein
MAQLEALVAQETRLDLASSPPCTGSEAEQGQTRGRPAESGRDAPRHAEKRPVGDSGGQLAAVPFLPPQSPAAPAREDATPALISSHQLRAGRLFPGGCMSLQKKSSPVLNNTESAASTPRPIRGTLPSVVSSRPLHHTAGLRPAQGAACSSRGPDHPLSLSTAARSLMTCGNPRRSASNFGAS